MGLETGTTIDDLVATNPVGATDPKSDGDGHLRLIKTALKTCFPGMDGAFGRIQSTGGTYTIVATDELSTIVATASITINVTASATLGNGFVCWVDANGGDVTLDPSTTELINGETLLAVPQGWSAMIFSTGSELLARVVPRVAGASVGAVRNAFLTALGSASSSAQFVAGDIVVSGATSRAGALICDGSAVSRTTYAGLFAAIASAYGDGDGSTTFNVPDFRGRTLIGAGTGSGLTPRARGQVGGEESHALTVAETPAEAVVGANGHDLVSNGGVLPTGNGDAHNNMQPYGVVNYFIVY